MGIGAYISANDAPGNFSAKPGDTFIDYSLGWRRDLLYVVTDTTLAGTLANGKVVYFVPASGGTYVVTDDISGSERNLVAGLAIGAITTGGYGGWIQTWGKNTEARKEISDSTDSISVGCPLIASATADGVGIKVANGTAPGYKPIGYALAAATMTSSTCTLMVQISKA